MNKQMNKEQSACFPSRVINSTSPKLNLFKSEEMNGYITEHADINDYLI